jgi:uncharacterized protein
VTPTSRSLSDSQPAGQPETRARDHLVDELRGVALLGIALVNAPPIAIASVGFSDASLATDVDHALAFVAIAFGQSKFYLIFSFLFGYSLPYLVKNGGRGPQPVFRRRIVALAVLGLAHGIFLFSGDILLLYASVSALVIWLVGWPDRAVLAAAAVSIALWCWALVDRLLAGNASPGGQAAFQQQLAQIDSVLATGTFMQAASARLELLPVMQGAAFWFYGMAVAALFCIGLIAGRRHWLRDPARRLHWWRRGLAAGLLLGLPGSLLSAWWLIGPGTSFTLPGPMQIEGFMLCFISAPALSMAYVCAAVLLRVRRPDSLRLFRPAGRMSMSVYLGSSLLLGLFACGFGLGEMGRHGAATVMLIAAAIWLLLNVFAHLWARRFARGPVEALLHAWTRWRL